MRGYGDLMAGSGDNLGCSVSGFGGLARLRAVMASTGARGLMAGRALRVFSASGIPKTLTVEVLAGARSSEVPQIFSLLYAMSMVVF